MKIMRYIGIDHSGAETPTASLKALRVLWPTRMPISQSAW
jgi:hypothetical protein